MKNNKKIALIAGGGTGGHLFPALSIGEELQKNNVNVKYIGSIYGVEKEFFKNFNLDYHLLNITGIQRNFSIKSIYINCLFPIRFIISYIKSLLIIRSVKPSIIIGTGGYASGLPLIAGIHLNIPTLIQDQNSIPGLITKRLHNKIDRICLAYDLAADKLNKKKCVITGNPIKINLKKYGKKLALEELKLDTEMKTILILGGSQGATPLNNHFVEQVNFYTKNNFQLIWQCGNKDYKYLKSKLNTKNILLKPFIDNMSQAYSACDLVISRAGAITISELSFMGKAMILIPYPYAAENHQYLNAKSIEKNNGCIIINQKSLSSGKLENKIKEIYKDENTIHNLEKNTQLLSKPNATKDIVGNILKLIS